MKKLLTILVVAGSLVACNSGDQSAHPSDSVNPRDRDTFVVDPTGTRGIDTTQPLLGAPIDTAGTGNQ